MLYNVKSPLKIPHEEVTKRERGLSLSPFYDTMCVALEMAECYGGI